MAAADNLTRKIKQEFLEQKPTNWSEFVYSSPNSPHQPHLQQLQELNFEHITNHPNNNHNNELSRRHSMSVGEMYYQSFDNKMQHTNYNELEQLFGASLPSSWSSSNSSNLENVFPSRRSMSLRLDTPALNMHRHSISTASPTTPGFFSPSFLDALKHEQSNQIGDEQMYDNDNTNSMSTVDNLMHDFMLNSNPTITPSIINHHDHFTWLAKDKHSPTVSTPSPPIYPSTILEEEEDDDEHESNHSKNQLILNRMIQGENNSAILKPLIQKYIISQFQQERKVFIFTSKVAQKSYGTEKRFLCPPPTTILAGASWFTKESTLNKPPQLVVHILGEKTSQNGVIEWKKNDTIVDSAHYGDAAHEMIGHCVSKHLHINDADEKRKRVETLVKITLGNGILLGTLASKGIKVISKPSKKRQSVKNIELCIHHGTTVSLFNRIRSQTVSTKYLGVSSTGENGTCFVARTSFWDPFVIWIVDTSHSPDAPPPQLPHHPDNPQFPAPPAIALRVTSDQPPVAIHYNQPVVLQCVKTGLVSPVMIIRKVDKGSMVLGGNRLDDLSGPTGGECGDEVLGDPVSQLHKIAFQIVHDPSIAHQNKTKATHHPNTATEEWVLPQVNPSITYLACLDNVVGMHKTTNERQFVASRPIPQNRMTMDAHYSNPMVWSDTFEPNFISPSDPQMHLMGGGGGKIINRKRRVSCDISGKNTSTNHRRRVNSLNDVLTMKQESNMRRSSLSSLADRRGSLNPDNNGACWTEDVSDASVWTIVGTDCASYKFYSPEELAIDTPITPFPVLTKTSNALVHDRDQKILYITGESFSRDLSIWFGDIRSTKTEYKSRETLSCQIPDFEELASSPTCIVVDQQHKIPILFVRGDGVVYNSDLFFTF